MYGSLFRMRPKQGMAQQLRETMMSSDRRPPGMKTAYLLSEDADGSVWGFAIFEGEEQYRSNASDPGQDAQYQKFRALLESDPEWHDGTIEQRPD
jgi:hypothetical protein